MAGYVSNFPTGAAIEAALNKANNSQSALNATQLKAVNSGADSAKITQIATNTDDIAINRAELVELVDNGNKNLLKCTAVSTEKNGITFTVNTDGSIVVNGTAPNDTDVDFNINDGAVSEIPADKVVVLSGCPEGGSNSTYALIAYSQNVSDIGEGVTFTTTESNRIYIRIYKGTTVNNLTFKPMICTKASWNISTEFMPYIPKGSIIDTLWSDSNGATVGTEYTMTGNINDYDAIYVKTGDVKDISDDNSYIQSSFLPSLIKDSEHLTLECYYYQRFMQISFNANKFTVVKAGANGEKSGYTPILWEIVGIKFGTGTNNTSTSVKTLTYTGDGGATTTITFPETPTVILSIDGPGTGTGMVNLSSFRFGAKAVSGSWSDAQTTSSTKANGIFLLAETNNTTLLLSGGQNVGSRCNVQGATYTVMYM